MIEPHFPTQHKEGFNHPSFFINTKKSIRAMKPSPRQLQETYKIHSQLVEHLIAEGYADDNESANKIIEGMSETWFDMIIK
jgi:hypothetical protein